ncbi:hypothetical protein lbkm_1336 [Lachnospiraceae bacterium KM106-2]|nr:hypothetical protein lbkm_1336 [Lachnospiraceae bacterium KM106-2]
MKFLKDNKDKWMKSSLVIGLVIFFIYWILTRFMTIPEVIAQVMCILSIILMLVGITYQGFMAGRWNLNRQEEKLKDEETKRKNQ